MCIITPLRLGLFLLQLDRFHQLHQEMQRVLVKLPSEVHQVIRCVSANDEGLLRIFGN